MLTPSELARLKKIRHVVMDMDGTIYHGKHLFPTTLPFLQTLKDLGIGYSFLTNNSSRSRSVYLEHLKNFGISAAPEQMITSTVNTVDYLRRNYPAVRKLFLLGTPAFRQEMTEYGFQDAAMEEEPDAVIVAFDTGLTYERLCKAAWWIKHEKLWICTHPDWECPTEQETTLVDCGSITACLKAVSNRTPIVLGKPNREMMEVILCSNRLQPEEVLMCGDRLYTDIQLGVNSGVAGVLISPRKAEEIPDNLAVWTIPDLGVLGAWLREAQGSCR